GGNPAVVDDPALLPQAAECEFYTAPRAGVVAAVRPRPIGYGVTRLGGGRTKTADSVDPTVGFVITVKPGDRVEAGQPLASIYARDARGIADGRACLDEAVAIADAAEPPLPLVSHRVSRAGVEPYAAA
ncbi:MAG: thymidine phosphorylase, partial [Gemmatimonadota bacterium]|nr:thymidine phosphorylase [Gemmatimonadota bacterium]